MFKKNVNKMDSKLLLLSLLSLFPSVLCDASLQIMKKVDKSYIPLSSTDSRFCLVEEKVGAHFSLLCELVFSRNETGYDDHISWIKKSNRFNATVDFDKLSAKNLEDFYDSLASSELNKAEKKFDPLKVSDNGSYICFTVKYKKYINIDIVVRSDERIIVDRPMVFREPMFCTDTMFKCMSNGVCIIRHYVCDGRADCKDGSDESFENCNGDPCKDKLRCDDGRCIPTAWCCDRNVDANCTVTNRPKCCQVSSETYEELEYGLPNLTAVQQNNASAKYLFISVCILSILFSLVLLLLILSKVMMFAKKTSLQQRHCPPDVAYYHQGSARTGRDQSIAMCHIPYNFYSFRDNLRDDLRNLPAEESDLGNPLLDLPGRNLDDRPPTYGELEQSRYSEPPPPYTSREVLNEDRN
ncbi:uncharacterized protein LOC123320054 [Coccinella septempunctata]|uniref:uncharacterized protein LOC123320054 n=1 Tax=Coccinella septempunctata TaxID=41139 RepID=UPI001D0935E7|nr:uncharacterized protein LOC123320054 [Coccinella septempunctata]